jgi:putative DNA methylase
MPRTRLIEDDSFPFEFLSGLAERESWRKEVHRPIYHVHKWWAKRLGSVFRGILLGSILPVGEDLAAAFHRRHAFPGLAVFDPFMGSGTTVGEAHKLGLTALGRDVNPVAVRAARTAFGPMDRGRLTAAFADLAEGVGSRIRGLYRTVDSGGRTCEALYYFWVMRAPCPACGGGDDLFPSRVIARNAYPDRKPQVQVLCPECGAIFPSLHGADDVGCPACHRRFDPGEGTVDGPRARCHHCDRGFKVLEAVQAVGTRPDYRLYGKLVLTGGGDKEYLAATADDLAAYRACGEALDRELSRGTIRLPTLELADGLNTRQAMGYGFRSWRDFFNDRQLLALGWLHAATRDIEEESARECLLTLFSGVLEFNNLFASYKGEGTGAVRHMFSHHVLKPERTPIEANVWGTPRSSGSFSGLFRGRLLRAIDYRLAPTEIGREGAKGGRECSPPFAGVVDEWPAEGPFKPRAVYLSCGDSATTGLPGASVDLVVTDPPFFDNVHYSELADFFHAWQQLAPGAEAAAPTTTRDRSEVQDADAGRFAAKLCGVFRECRRVLKEHGLLIFTYHHSRDEGWAAVADAILRAGFVVVNSAPVRSEMSTATPKSQAREPIQLDIILTCRKDDDPGLAPARGVPEAVAAAQAKLRRLVETGFRPSVNDRRVVLSGQLLTTLRTADESAGIAPLVDRHMHAMTPIGPVGATDAASGRPEQNLLFS